MIKAYFREMAEQDQFIKDHTVYRVDIKEEDINGDTDSWWVDNDYYNKLSEIMAKKFKSVVFHEFGYKHFYFRNNADNAHFLLWGNEGIELWIV